MQLWGCEDLVVGVLGATRIKRFDKSCYEVRTGSTSITSEDDTRRRFGLYFQFGTELVVGFDEGLIRRGIGQRGGVSLPRPLNIPDELSYDLAEVDVVRVYTSSISPYFQEKSAATFCNDCNPKAYHWVHQFDSIIIWRIVARSDHYSNDLTIQLS